MILQVRIHLPDNRCRIFFRKGSFNWSWGTLESCFFATILGLGNRNPLELRDAVAEWSDFSGGFREEFVVSYTQIIVIWKLSNLYIVSIFYRKSWGRYEIQSRQANKNHLQVIKIDLLARSFRLRAESKIDQKIVANLGLFGHSH